MKGLNLKAIQPIALFLGGTLTGLTLSGIAVAYQGNMQSALSHLQQAKEDLIRATPDKKGHRVQAIRLVNDAIAQTQAGISAARFR